MRPAHALWLDGGHRRQRRCPEPRGATAMSTAVDRRYRREFLRAMAAYLRGLPEVPAPPPAFQHADVAQMALGGRLQ